MSAYLTRTEFQDQTLPADAFTGLSTAQIDTAIAWASSQADSYLCKRYKLPLVSWSENLRQNVANLAQWYVLGRRGIRPGSGNNEMAQDRYKDSLEWFRDLAKGIVEIQCVDSTPSLEEQGPLAAASGGPRANWNMTTGRRRCGTVCVCGSC